MDIFQIIVVQPIFNFLLGLYSLIPGGDFGVALVIFTILVRFALWPMVKKQLHQARAMQKLQPELVRIKKECKGNKQLESMQMMELYKKHGVSPFRSIGILFIQLPIFIALFQVIQVFIMKPSGISTEVSRLTYGFMKGIGPINELIVHPEQFSKNMLGIFDLTARASTSNPLTISGAILIILVIGSAVTQYIMSKQTMPKQQSKKKLRDIMSAAADGKPADQSEMNAAMMGSMTKFLPIMMLFIMYSLPGALVLYYTVSNLVAVIQQASILKKDSEELIEIADEAPVKPGKKATAKAREKVAREATIVRIVAKDNSPRKSK